MSEPARNRFALDLDDLERQLRGAAQPQRPGASSDPLMELTRLVGQDDPLKELFAGRPGQQPDAGYDRAPMRTEPAFQPTLVGATAARPAAPPDEVRGALDEFEALLRRTEPGRPAVHQAADVAAEHEAARGYDEPEPAHQHDYAQPYAMQHDGAHAYVPEAPRDLDEAAAASQGAAYQPDYAAGPAYDEAAQVAEAEARDFQRPRSRKGLLAGATLAVVAIGGVGAAMMFRDTRPAGVNGQPPVIAADNGPAKVAPVNPGGAEIPNQNKQIYERSGDSATDKTKVVTREEQPVDVQQAARAMAPRPTQAAGGSITPTDTAGAGIASAEPGLVPIPAVPGLGEPRKVRTVAIRPDGTPAATNAVASNNAGGGIVTGSAPANRPVATTPAAQPQVPPRQDQASATPAPAPKTQERAAPPVAAATPQAAQTPAAATRTAALAPQQQAQPAASVPRADPSGGFAVQLGAPGSEAEARATFAALQRKYPDQLSGQSPIIRKTELAGGKTVYRLRVGPYAREDASSMCSALQSAGGQCFIAKN